MVFAARCFKYIFPAQLVGRKGFLLKNQISDDGVEASCNHSIRRYFDWTLMTSSLNPLTPGRAIWPNSIH